VFVLSLVGSVIAGVLAGLWALISVPGVCAVVWMFILLVSQDYKVVDLVVVSSEQVFGNSAILLVHCMSQTGANNRVSAHTSRFHQSHKAKSHAPAQRW
jgi:hypothetical protein